VPARSHPLNPGDGPLAQFATELRRLRDHAATPMSPDQAATQKRVTTSRASIYAALAGTRLPSRQTLYAIVKAWAPGGLDDLPQWNERRSQIEGQLVGIATDPVRDGTRPSPNPVEPTPAIRAFWTQLDELRAQLGSPKPAADVRHEQNTDLDAGQLVPSPAHTAYAAKAGAIGVRARRRRANEDRDHAEVGPGKAGSAATLKVKRGMGTPRAGGRVARGSLTPGPPQIRT
jgi:hypothetical protein